MMFPSLPCVPRIRRSIDLVPLGLVVIAAVLLKLAISDGGRDLPSLTLVETVIFALLAVLAWSGVVRNTPVTRPLLAMLLAVAFSSLWSVRPEVSVRQLLLWTMYSGVAVITASTLRGAMTVRRFLDALVVIANWLCLIALFMFWGADQPEMRWYATFYWPNPFAAFLLLVFPLAVVRLVHAGSLRDTMVHGAAALLLGVALVLTYSRGAWLALLLMMPLGVAVLRPRRWSVTIFRMALLIAVILMATVALTRGTALRPSPESVVGRAASAADPPDYSIRGRLHFWRAGMEIFADHPIVGTGPGTFGAIHAVYQRDTRYYARDPHNIYIQTAAEMGLVGLAALGLLLAATVTAWLRGLGATRGQGEYPFVAGVGLGLAAFGIHSAIDMNWMFPANPAVAFALIGVLAYYTHANRPVPAPATVPQRAAVQRLAAAGLVVAAGVAVVMQLAQREFVAAQAQARMGHWAAAVERYRRAAQWNPLSAGYHSVLAIALMQTAPADVGGAAGVLRRAMVLDRMNAEIPLQLAQLHMDAPAADLAALVEAESLLRRSLALDPWNRPTTYRTLARLYLRQGRIVDADLVYADALPRYVGRNLGTGSAIYLLLWPDVVGLFLDAAEASVQRGDRVRASQILEALLAEDPDVVPAVVRLSEIYAAADRQNDARRLLEAAATRMPDNGVIAAALAALR